MNTLPDLNLRHLEAVSAAGRLGSISKAAQAMNLSQPAITQAVAKLESQLDHALLDRQPAGVTFTRAGALLAERTDRALAYITRGGQSVRRAARLPPLPHIGRRITFGHLRTLTTVDQAGSFALASTITGLSEPALHRSARDLEQLLGLLLLVRQGRTVQPTPAASVLLRHARLALAELQSGLDELAALRVEGAGRVTVGTLPMAQAILLPRALSRFSALYPTAQISVVEGPYSDLLASLRSGQVDLLIGALRDPAPTRDITQEALFADDPVIVARAGHPLAGAPLDMAQLLDFPWIVATATAPVRRRWEAMFEGRGLPLPARRIETNSIVISRGLLLDDDWLTLMSRDQFAFERRSGLLTEIADDGMPAHRRIGITTRADWHPTHLQAEFARTFRDVTAEWSSGNPMAGKPFRYA
ncbi:LysR family transcriptional regulator [Falsirhodobacter sp. 20TX0035]|uniref:LysR family transcriptional regulator n=1 Tax=Falsirhodobacter sp. 20TX0035 TaxID=3022019 RepID=UPI00232DD572|nr:LysR substrate-binding domain-containing protein [Falsirhodobacter sp. 20TX0035]MDB6452994.1 LysR substrate-binding domain-containing protein [Falsirhodobacter sp. 20TX0035]